jgi:hypothetical protein
MCGERVARPACTRPDEVLKLAVHIGLDEIEEESFGGGRGHVGPHALGTSIDTA